jgi:hypothetical protein
VHKLNRAMSSVSQPTVQWSKQMTDTNTNANAAANNCGNANIINVGTIGNIKPIIFAPGQTYTVGDVLNRAGFCANGYELRISGDATSLDSPVLAGQTVLLLKKVTGA